MGDGSLRRLFWRVADLLDYLVTLARLRAGRPPSGDADRPHEWTDGMRSTVIDY